MAQRWHKEDRPDEYKYQVKRQSGKLRPVEQREEEYLEDPRIIHMDRDLFELLIDNSPEGMHLELIDGVLYNMAPPSDNHEQMKGSLFYLLREQLPPDGPCRFMSEQYVEKEDIPSTRPDITLTCNQADWDDDLTETHKRIS